MGYLSFEANHNDPDHTGKVDMSSVPQSGHDGPYDAPITIATLRVEEDWIDFNNHMNAAHYGWQFQKQAEKFLEETVGFGISFAKAEGAGPFVLQNQIIYKNELLVDEVFSIRMTLLDHDAKRAHMYFEMVSKDSGSLCATAEYVNMNVDLAKRKPVDFPPWLKSRWEQMQRDHSQMARPLFAGAAIGLRR